MARQKTIAVIPARMASSRYPGKPLAMILGLPMIEHVRRRALLAVGVDEVIVATCDREIAEEVERAGGTAVMTSPRHEHASERVAEAARALHAEVVVVVQGDEPLLLPEVIQHVSEPFAEDESLVCVSLLSPLESEADYGNPNIVKAACDRRGFVLYFSRAPIPYFQRSFEGGCPVYRETGIRAFRAGFLQTYADLPQTPLEQIESVDMLRLLEHGYKILGVPTEYPTIGVDYAEDVPRIERILKTDPVQQQLYRRITREM